MDDGDLELVTFINLLVGQVAVLILNLHIHLLPLAQLQFIRTQFFSHSMQLLRLSTAILIFFDYVGLLF